MAGELDVHLIVSLRILVLFLDWWNLVGTIQDAVAGTIGAHDHPPRTVGAGQPVALIVRAG